LFSLLTGATVSRRGRAPLALEARELVARRGAARNQVRSIERFAMRDWELDSSRAVATQITAGARPTIAAVGAVGALEIEGAVEYALASPGITSPGAVRPADALTPREREVACLVAEGLSNREVAERLVLTEKTAANHVERIFEKLGLQSRSQLAARATDLGLANRDPGNAAG
jgi:non-specific serine/threonine protein kinase